MVIDFNNDPNVTDALLHWRERKVFTTDMGSLDLRRLSRELHLRSITSARTTNAEYLNEVAQVVDDMLSGKINMATGRLRLMRSLKQLGYDPAVGFPQDMANIPPAERGSLQDLSSERRIDLMLETNMRVAANYGRVVAGNTEAARYAYPAWELVRLYSRKVPRGTPDSHSVGWQRRWQDAEEKAQGSRLNAKGRMIALKDSPIWIALGEGAGGYEDTLGNPFPPFAFNSGMAFRAVPRVECIALGLIEPDETPGEMEAHLAPGEDEFDREMSNLAPDLAAAMRRILAT